MSPHQPATTTLRGLSGSGSTELFLQAHMPPLYLRCQEALHPPLMQIRPDMIGPYRHA